MWSMASSSIFVMSSSLTPGAGTMRWSCRQSLSRLAKVTITPSGGSSTTILPPKLLELTGVMMLVGLSISPSQMTLYLDSGKVMLPKADPAISSMSW